MGKSDECFNVFGLINYPLCFSDPLRVETSAWLSHVPFGMFLVDLLRPQVLVELGTHTGVSYCGFCQAIQELDLNTRCYAFDTWQGDPQTGFYDSEVLKALHKYHDPLYGSFSKLIRSTFDDAVKSFEDRSIDLLHVDGLHTYEAVKADYENWLPKMSDRGVMLFHDINVRYGDFEVWKFWEEVSSEYLHFEMVYGFGLGLLAVGHQIPNPLYALLQSSDDDLANFREFFYQLGLRVEQLLKDKQAAGKREARISELEAFVTKLQNNPFFKTYHLIKYLGRS